jgi:hypothetical protein
LTTPRELSWALSISTRNARRSGTYQLSRRPAPEQGRVGLQAARVVDNSMIFDTRSPAQMGRPLKLGLRQRCHLLAASSARSTDDPPVLFGSTPYGERIQRSATAHRPLAPICAICGVKRSQATAPIIADNVA